MKRAIATLVLLLATASGPYAFGHSLKDRVGVGVMLHDLNSLASFSLRYTPDLHYGIGFVAGFDTGSSGFNIFGGRVNRFIDLQENLNAYLGVAAYYLARASSGVTSHGYQMDALIGVEAFLPGLSDLGITFETGIGYRSLGGISLRTLGSGFLATAIHYYF